MRNIYKVKSYLIKPKFNECLWLGLRMLIPRFLAPLHDPLTLAFEVFCDECSYMDVTHSSL